MGQPTKHQVCAKDGHPIELDKGVAVDLEFQPAHGARMLGIQA